MYPLQMDKNLLETDTVFWKEIVCPSQNMFHSAGSRNESKHSVVGTLVLSILFYLKFKKWMQILHMGWYKAPLSVELSV